MTDYEVPNGRFERDAFMEEKWNELDNLWVNGNRAMVWDRLMKLPKPVAVAIAARLGNNPCVWHYFEGMV